MSPRPGELLCFTACLALASCGDADQPPAEPWADPRGGLVWQRAAADINYVHDGAVAHCQALDESGHSDWRLPTIDELRTLIVGCAATAPGGVCGVKVACTTVGCWDSRCNGCADMAGPQVGCYWPSALGGVCTGYWSSSLRTDTTTRAWGVGFFSGYVGGYSKRHEGLHARCVRGP